MQAKFAVTFETITEESASRGDTEETGFVCEGATLRDAVDALGCGHIEANCYPVTLATAPRWFTRYGEADYKTGDIESRALHLPDSITRASRIRLARLLRCYGV